MWSFKRNDRSSSSSARSSPKNNPHTTIVQLRESILNAEKREEHLERKIEATVQDAKTKLARGNKKSALFAMKRKKLYQAELDKLENVKMTLETQAIQLESAAHNQETFRAMESGNTTMARLRRAFGIDKVDTLMEDIREEMDLATEVNGAIGTPLDPYMEDDQDLLAELEALDDSPKQTSAAFSMPKIPRFRKVSHSDDANDLKRLEAELAAE